MNDDQMEGLLASLRQQQDKTNALSDVLAQFNEAFNTLLNQLLTATNLENLEQSTQRVSELEQRLQRIENQLKENKVAEVEIVNRLDKRLSAIEKIFKQEYENDLEEAKQEGIKEGKYAVVKKMLEQGHEIESVLVLTELSRQELEMLIDPVRQLEL